MQQKTARPGALSPPVRLPVRLAVRLAGTGHALPANMVSSEELDKQHGFEPGYLARLSGVQSRPVCGDENQIDLAVAAAEMAIAEAGIAVTDIDLVLGASGIPYQTLPATAPLVMGRLGLSEGKAAAFDVNATCLSFLTALDIAALKVASGACRAALIFSSEIASRALPWQRQPDVAALFGDGAGAAVVMPAVRGGLRASMMRTYPSGYAACEIGAGGTRFDLQYQREAFMEHAVFSMDGKALFRLTRRYFAAFLDDVLLAAGWARGDVDLVVPHQASPLALQHLIIQSGLAPERIVNIAASHGNQIAASIPIALDMARKQGRIGPGARVLMIGTSAGVSFGAIALEM
ncbi:MAG: ketoacyl-ACP synthase III [Rhodobacteraceae bacterium]|nr:ketoacyl-ACP synthase III [Paracoccaceae bacterium]